VFDKYDIETIAPGYGCILRGRNVVARHYANVGRDSQGLRQERGRVALRHARRGALIYARQDSSQQNAARDRARRILDRRLLAQRHKGKIYHGYNAAFLVAGETASGLVETGHPKDFPVIERHMNELFARGVAPLKYLFVTHQETPHCGGLAVSSDPSGSHPVR